MNSDEILARLTAVVDSSENAIVGIDTEGMINTWNKAACELFGYKADEIIGQSFLLLIPPSLHHEQYRNLERLRAGERISPYEAVHLRKGGHRIDVLLSLVPIRNPEGTWIGSAVTARKLGELRPEERDRARLAAIVDSSEDAIVAKDLNGVVTDWNKGAERLFGYTAEEMVGRSILTIIPPELQHQEPWILEKIRAGERIEHFETQRVRKNGERVEVSLTMSPIRDAAGRIVGASKIARNVSERRKLEAARLFLAAIVESSDDAIVSKNLDGIITSWNAAAERLLGYKAEEIIGESVLRIIPPELHYEEPGIISRLKAGQRIEHFETRRRRKDGQLIDVSLTVSPIKNDRNEVIGGSKILRDIRERKAAEAAIMEREKFAAAGRLAATLAHEVNNPLESITNLAYLLTRNDSLDKEAHRYAEMLLSEVQRAGEITRKTLGYYRESSKLSEVDLAQLLEHVLHAKRKKIEAKNIAVRVESPSVFSLKASAGELRQVFDNLVENAIDAVPFEGSIEVMATAEDRDARHYLSVTVSDNGPGIPLDVMPRIFEPFFTTKVGKGSGLGLWVSRALVEKMGGKIEIESRRAQPSGTRFRVILPLAAHEPPSASAPSAATQKVG